MSVFLVAGLVVMASLVRAQEPEQSEKEAMYYRYLEFSSYVKGGSIEPHWMADGSSFWYAEGAPANTVIWRVDPVANTKTPLFDTERLREALTPVLGHEPPYQGLAFETFSFMDGGEKAVRFSLEGKDFILHLDTYSIRPAPLVSEAEKRRLAPQVTREGDNGDSDLLEVPSPDGRWFAGLRGHDIWLRSSYDGRRVQLTTGGVENYDWADAPWDFGPMWSPNSMKLAVKRGDYRKVPKIPFVHYLKPMEVVQWVPYAWKAGAPIEQEELYILDILSKRPVKVEIGESPYERVYKMLGWLPDGSEFLFIETGRFVREIRLAAVNPTTGAAREITRNLRGDTWDPPLVLLDSGDRFIWQSWENLYLYDIDGTLIRRLTRGPFPVVRVVTVDEKTGWVYFIAGTDRERPYDTHLCRVNLEGQGFEQLTEAPGQHDIQIFGNVLHRIEFSPSKQFFLDTHSSPSRPPTVELRQADGLLLQTLSKANTDALQELRWSPPEEFVVKAADGKTDLYGVLYKPYDFDPNKKYPVIEHIYGFQSQAVRTFIGRPRRETSPVWPRAMAQLGFITVKVDGPGPFPRSQEAEQGLFGHQIPDHVAALRQLAETRPYMDLNRVGIIGLSLGGYYVVRAMLQAPDVYHVGIAVAPVIDLYTHTNHLFLGPPESNKEAYEDASVLRLAGNLKGKLLLIHGTSDYAVPFSHTMKMVEALIRADKPYDLMVLPEWGHWVNGTRQKEDYRLEAHRRYFQEHLKP